MPRTPRITLPGVAQHIVQRGNNRQPTFTCDEDMAAYASWLKDYANKFEVDIHAWVFMSNHVHLLVTPHSVSSTSKLMQSLGRMYVSYFNQKYNRTGTLWEGRFKSFLVQDEQYLLDCYRYIELNPVNACMVENPAEYKWSSYRTNAFGTSSILCTPHPEYLKLGSTPEERQANYQAMFNEKLDSVILKRIRAAAQSGDVLGNKQFKQEIKLRENHVRAEKRKQLRKKFEV